MKFEFAHNNINVLDLQRSIEFYKKALFLEETRRIDNASFTLVFLGDNKTKHLLELTWLKDRTEAYDLGDNEIHLAFRCVDMDAAYKYHKEMGCVCFENTAMGIYFIEDPDGYWIEIIPA